MNYKQALTELELLGIMPTTMPSLAPMERALVRSGLKQRIPAESGIIIAGTNGKGTTAATLSALLTAAGKRVGLYTSPHLVSACERMRINDHDITEDDFTAAYLAVKDIVIAEGLTHFEALTLMAAHVFYSGGHGPPVDHAIWEVGLGGQCDATNAIPHHHCAITQLSMDHQDILGGTLEDIARQKFGVIGKDAVVVHSPMDASLAPLRAETTARTHCRWISAEPLELGRVALNLRGARAAENTATALTLFKAMGFDPNSSLHALQAVRWPGRFSPLGGGLLPCPLYLSGDHNPAGIDSLIEILNTMSWKTLHLIVGIGRDKDATLMFEKLLTLPRARLYLTETPFKPFRIQEYPARIRNRAEISNHDVFHILSCLNHRTEPDDIAVITGSLYLVGHVLAAKQPLQPGSPRIEPRSLAFGP